MSTIEYFVTRVELRPSPIHGQGLFATRPIKKGTYIARGLESVMNVVKRSGAGNSPLLPPFVELMSLDSDHDPPSMMDRLTKLKSGFAAFKEEERSLANFDYELKLLGAPSLTVIVHRDLEAGEELLRSYGDEWISIKYYHFQATWLSQRSNAAARKDSQTYVMFVAEVDAYMQPCVEWVKDEESLPDVAAQVSLVMEKSVRAITIDEVKAWASLLGMLGIEKFGKGDIMFDMAWKDNVTRLKTEKLG
jgi:hypothetical protein